MKEPESMEECIYFTRRDVDNGKVMAWVFKGECSACHKGLMGKPVGDDGKVKIRAKEYVCPECGHTEEKKAHEETLECNIKYTCPHCKYEGETSVPFKRKKIKGADAIIFLCEKCKEKIPITKKMKGLKE